MSFHCKMIEKPQYHPNNSESLWDGTGEIYQLNNFGMSMIIEMMDSASLLDKQMEEPFEDWPPDGLDEVRAEEIMEAIEFEEEVEPPLTDLEQKIIDQYNKHVENIMTISSDEEGKVPLFKFGSNDGWQILPEECKNIADTLKTKLQNDEEDILSCHAVRRIGQEEAKRTLLEWIEFNSLSAKNGGYKIM